MNVVLFIIVTMIAALLLGHQTFKRHLERKSRTYANETFPDRYFDTKYHFFRQTLPLKGHRVIHWHQGKKTVINLYQVDRVSVRLFRLAIHTKNQKTVHLPLRFERLVEIYAIFKYHRPDDSRTTLSTRYAYQKQ
ncbi:hypothetical protein [Evansella clarkii]|uniref:hypothetical protein n=1 Tax=Evansella clarkii TaxID=79879 RepID=UPI0009960858|nr:hypothetical protein [Evansella clarkii]